MNEFTTTRPARQSRWFQHGFSLIELMVAMFLGLLVSAGIITLFSSTSKANRIQTQLARMQEQGRFVVNRVVSDLQMSSAQYCSNSGGLPTNAGTSVAPIYLQDQPNTPLVYVDAQKIPGTNYSNPGAPTEPYPLPADFYMRGYECTDSTCTPSVPSNIPGMGTAAGNRIKGTDVLMLRALRGLGWSLDAGYSTQAPAATSTSGAIELTSITLAPSASTEPPASHFVKGDLAMLAECSRSQVFAVTKAGNVLTPDPSKNFNTPGIQQPTLAGRASTQDPRLYDFSRDFVTTNYYLELKADDNPDAPAGKLVGVLMRQINNEPAEELVRGVERFDLRYGVVNRNGATSYLTADQVDSRAGGALTCPVGAKGLPDSWLDSSQQLPGCLWRAVKTIEVNMLLDSADLSNVSDEELHYVYPPDGSSVQSPPANPTNGLSRNMMRRSFTALIAVRNNNF